MKTTVIHHSADFDGLFCREIARKFLPDAELIGWDFADKPLELPEGKIYVMDLPLDAPFGKKGFSNPDTLDFSNVVWIDHHKSAIESHPANIPGYRIDGVAACRLAWQWFNRMGDVNGVLSFPRKEHFVERVVEEPFAVRLSGEYDVWDKRDPNADTLQFGLRSRDLTEEDWNRLLRHGSGIPGELLAAGDSIQFYQRKMDAEIIQRGFLLEFEGLTFLALNITRCNSLTFMARDEPETGHDALMGFYWNGRKWTVSLYHARHNTGIDLSEIAVRHGGGGHRGACGFVADKLPFIP